MNKQKQQLTAWSKWDRAKSMFFVCVRRMLPSWRWVRASTRGGGLKWKTACRHWMHDLIFGGFDVRKFSAKPSNDRYQASWDDAILTFHARRTNPLLSPFTLHSSLVRSSSYLTVERACAYLPRFSRIFVYATAHPFKNCIRTTAQGIFCDSLARYV